MPKTLLAVDDSATMRKVLEITFAGDDFRVVAADSAATALGGLGEDPVAAVIDASLGGDDSYALAKEMRTRNPRLALVLMVSRYNPYDPNRGRDAGVDDFIDKPFDTQMLIDKVKKAMGAREGARSLAPTPAAAAPPAPPPAAFSATASFGSPPRPAPTAAGSPSIGASPPAGAKPAFAAPRTHTLSFEGALPIVPAPIINPSSVPMPRAASTPQASHVHTPTPPPPGQYAPPAAARPPAEPPPTVSPVSPVGPAGNGQFGKKLGELGLTAAQADAVLALSRDLVEKVVWEVVPQIAEAMIREEIARLTKEG